MKKLVRNIKGELQRVVVRKKTAVKRPEFNLGINDNRKRCQKCGILLSNKRKCKKCGKYHGAYREPGIYCLDCEEILIKKGEI